MNNIITLKELGKTKTNPGNSEQQYLDYTVVLEQHRFELHRSTCMGSFFNKYIGNFFEICDNFKNLSDELHSLEILKKLRKS